MHAGSLHPPYPNTAAEPNMLMDAARPAPGTASQIFHTRRKRCSSREPALPKYVDVSTRLEFDAAVYKLLGFQRCDLPPVLQCSAQRAPARLGASRSSS